MRRFVRHAVATTGLLALTVLGSNALPGQSLTHVQAQSTIAGHVYVNDNTAGTNTLSGFDRHKDGTLTPMTGSPFPTGGAGTGAILGSQGALQMTADGDYLIAVDAGSSEISVLGVAEDGALSLVGDAVASGGINPLSIAIYDDLVYVANAGDGKSGSNYTGFRLDADGVLTPIPDSTVLVSATAMVGDVLFDSTGTHLIGVEVGPDAGPSFIDSFTVNPDGTLTAAPGSPFPSQVVGPFGSVFSPANTNQLYVSNAHAGPNMGSLSIYTVADDGTLKANPGSPFPNTQTGSCWVEISADGRYVFVVNTGVPSISRYEVQDDGSVTLLGSTVFNNPTGLRPFDARFSPDGSFLYVVDAGQAKVSAFAVDGGDLTELAASPIPLPSGATPFGIVVS